MRFKFELDPKKDKGGIESRRIYGVAESDTWGFDHYLLAVLANGLASMAEKAHGWPQSEKMPEFEDWQKALQSASDDAYWCVKEYERLTTELANKFYGPLHEKHGDDLEGFLKDKLDSQDAEVYDAEARRLADERELRKDRLMDFIKEYFWSLWD